MKSVQCMAASLALVLVFSVGQLSAQDTSGEKAQAKCQAQCPSQLTVATSTDDKDGAVCPVTQAMNKLPQMTYRVGDEATCCAESAAALAKKGELPIQYVVAKKNYEDKTAAYTALVEETEEMVNAFITPAKCEVSGKTSVAGKSCDCPVQAGQLTEMVKTATDALHMTYKVGDKACHCPMEAASLAKKSGEETLYIVNGETTSCELTARLNLARAKYKAAVETIVKADKEAKADNDS